MAVNKCNITGYIKPILDKSRIGIKYNLSSKAILENYTQWLNCSTETINVCYPDNCVNVPLVYTCSMALARITSTIFNRVITFSITDGDLTNYTAPLTYIWNYDSSVFILSGSIHQSTLVLYLTGTRLYDYLVTTVSVTIKDANGCSITKSCTLVSEEMDCSGSIPCPNLSSLVLSNPVTYCTSPMGLIINKV